MANPKRSDLNSDNKLFFEKSAPYPPVATTTNPNSYLVSPALFTYSQPITSPFYSMSLVTLALVINLAHSPFVYFSNSSHFSINPYVIVIPGNFSLPLWVLSLEWPPNLLTKERSIPKSCINQSTAGPDSLHKTSIISVGLQFSSPKLADLVVSYMKISGLS